MYYNIKVIGDINIQVIVIVISITQSSACNDAGILVLNRNPDYNFFLDVLIKPKTDFKISSESNLPNKSTQAKLLQNAPRSKRWKKVI